MSRRLETNVRVDDRPPPSTGEEGESDTKEKIPLSQLQK